MQRNWIITFSQITLVCLLLFLLIGFVPMTAKADPNDAAHTLFLPIVSSSSVPVDSSVPPPTSCNLNAQETQIAEFLKNHSSQRRTALNCDPTLSAVARARAEDMGRRKFFGHVNPDGQGPNYLVRQAGYTLPPEYSTAMNGNNIESIGAGAGDATGMWNAWMQSEKHVTHLLGQDDFFGVQTDYGIGFAQVPGSPYQFYWVVISSKPVN